MSGSGASESFSYNALGQLTGDSRGAYAYTPTGRLATVSGAVSASYAYDPDDLRVVRTVNGQTLYTIRGAGGQILSEYQSACAGALAWSRDLLYVGGRLLGAAKSATAVPVVEVTATAASVSEAATSATVGVRLTSGGPLPCAVTVAWETRPGTATPGADYETAAGTITFPAGTPNGAVQHVTVTLLPDTIDEDDETFVVALGSPVGAIAGAAAAQTITILDDDPTPAMSVADVTVAEPETGSGSAVLTVSLSHPSGHQVRADFATVSGTAVAGQDFVAASGPIVFEPGQTSHTVAITILPDTLPELAETFTVVLSNVQHATPPAGPATVTIAANDSTMTVGVTANRTFPSPAGTSITFTGAGSGGVAPYEYLFRLTQHGTGTTRVVQTYFAVTTWTWMPAAPGTYTVEVWGRTQGSTAPLQGLGALGPFTISAPPAVTVSSLTANASFPMATGTAVTLTATAGGGVAPLQYEFWVEHANTATWSVFRPYGAASTVTWIAQAPGSYNFAVRVRSAGSAAAYEGSTGLFGGAVNAGWPSIAAFAPALPMPVAVNTPVTWTTTASGTPPLEYKYWAYRPSTSWLLLQDWTTASSFVWTPSATDTYSVAVHVRVVGSPLYYDVAAEVPHQIVVSGPIGSTGSTANSSLPVTVGTPITWTATATGGTGPLEYEFWLYDSSTETWTTPRAYSPDPTWIWTPGAVSFGQHAVVVRIRRIGSGVAWEAAANSGHFTVTP